MHQLPPPGAELVAPDCCRGDRINRSGGRCQANVKSMNGLRIYKNAETHETRGGRPVFYSRREEGPHYRWFYDEASGEWRVGRVLQSDISRRMFSLTPWKDLPVGLQKSMIEHYLD